jgi:peroxiredoxin
VTFTDAKGLKQQAPQTLGPIGMPGNFAGDEQLNQNVKKVTELPLETLNLPDGPVSCRVLQVEYDRPGWQPEERIVKYWVDEARLLVLKEEFSQFQRHEHKSTLWHWVYEAESIKVNQPPPDWLVESAKRSTTQIEGGQLTKWIDKNAPDFTLTDLDDHSVSLNAMKGSVVVLNFWATWCGPCIAEMPTIAKVANDYKPKGVVFWGISAEQPAALKRWLAQNQPGFTIVVDKDGDVTEDYRTEGIPALVVVSRNGKIRSFYSGPQSEPSLRAAIDEALHD